MLEGKLRGLQFLASLDLPPPRSTGEYLKDLTVTPLLLQDFRPVAQSLEWELSKLSWAGEGVMQFVSGRVPFVINNNGRSSEAAARVLYASLLDVPPHSTFEVVELGAGCGLFARYFLNSFADLCKAEKRDWFDHLVYFVTDASRRTVEQWREIGIFADFGPRVEIGTCEASRPETATTLDGKPLRPDSLRCVIANYLLDVLPATIARRGRDGAEELAIRTNLTRSP